MRGYCTAQLHVKNPIFLLSLDTANRQSQTLLLTYRKSVIYFIIFASVLFCSCLIHHHPCQHRSCTLSCTSPHTSPLSPSACRTCSPPASCSHSWHTADTQNMFRQSCNTHTFHKGQIGMIYHSWLLWWGWGGVGQEI